MAKINDVSLLSNLFEKWEVRSCRASKFMTGPIALWGEKSYRRSGIPTMWFPSNQTFWLWNLIDCESSLRFYSGVATESYFCLAGVGLEAVLQLSLRMSYSAQNFTSFVKAGFSSLTLASSLNVERAVMATSGSWDSKPSFTQCLVYLWFAVISW